MTNLGSELSEVLAGYKATNILNLNLIAISRRLYNCRWQDFMKSGGKL